MMIIAAYEWKRLEWLTQKHAMDCKHIQINYHILLGGYLV